MAGRLSCQAGSSPRHEYFHRAGKVGCAREAGIPGEEDRPERVRERHIDGVVHGQVRAQRPGAVEERQMRYPACGKVAQIRERQGGAPCVEPPSGELATEHREDLDLGELGHDESLSAQTGASAIAVRAVVGQRRDEDTGVNDEHARA